jgi:hypothetical protein
MFWDGHTTRRDGFGQHWHLLRLRWLASRRLLALGSVAFATTPYVRSRSFSPRIHGLRERTARCSLGATVSGSGADRRSIVSSNSLQPCRAVHHSRDNRVCLTTKSESSVRRCDTAHAIPPLPLIRVRNTDEGHPRVKKDFPAVSTSWIQSQQLRHGRTSCGTRCRRMLSSLLEPQNKKSPSPESHTAIRRRWASHVAGVCPTAGCRKRTVGLSST